VDEELATDFHHLLKKSAIILIENNLNGPIETACQELSQFDEPVLNDSAKPR
jgi:hypothetical protein